jgi:hypothetical protein
MSDKLDPIPVKPETQKERWVKYGANVALVSVIVVVLGFFVAAIAQTSTFKARIDTTRAGLYSLKPQTKQILRDLKQNVRIVSLYTRNKQAGAKDADDLATPVADLLDEYKRNSGGKIDVEIIDPVENPSKVDDLIASVTERYGGEVKQYRDFIDGYAGKDKTEDQVRKMLAEEVREASAIPEADVEGSKLGRYTQSGSTYAKSFMRQLDDTKKLRERQLKEKPPNYKRAADLIDSDMQNLSENVAQLLKLFDQQKDEPGASEAVKKYAAAARPRFEAIKKQADTVAEQVKKLGSLKLDDLRRQLRVDNGILVMGPNDMKVLPQEQVWQDDPNIRRQLSDPNANPKPRFAGEQQITSAILALTQEKKLKVAFVRPGGGPLTQSGGFFGPSGPLSMIAARLREYNFDVVEKDLSGMWAMQQQMQQRGMPPEPEPSDEEIKDAIWVVLSVPTGGGPMGPPPSIAPKVQEHLSRGGSALMLFLPRAEAFDAALEPWGLKVRTDAMVVHQPVPDNGAPTTDIVELAKRQPATFVLSEYGDHMLAKPLQSLDTAMLGMVPVSTTPKPGYKQWNLLPVPTDPRSWGETNIESTGESGEVAFDKDADIPGPLFGGAAAQKDDGSSRVVAIGSVQFLINELLAYPDRDLLERDIYTPRFPGSAELFINSIFWLAKMEPMIAISPSAMEVSRIKPMSETGQWFWRKGVLLIGLPLLVVAAGGLMWVRRRD